MFKKLFGVSSSSSSQPVIAPSTTSANKTIGAIQNLSDQEETLEKRKALLEKKVDAELAKAQEFLRAKKKPQALLCMKRKKMFEAEMANLDNMIMRISEQVSTLRGQHHTVDVVSAMRQAAVVSKQNMKGFNTDSVEKVMDLISDANDQMRTINEAFSNPTGYAADLDEDELIAELEGMEEQQLEEQLMAPASVPTTRVAAGTAARMPSVPQKAAAKKTTEQVELEALEAEMALS